MVVLSTAVTPGRIRSDGAGASVARAMASASSRITEPTPGRMPAAVTQCTNSVGTP
jgi:hypothetical protein